MGEGPHSALQKFFLLYLALREQDWGVLVWPEHRVQVAATRFRIPVVCLTRSGDPFEEIIRIPPLLCIEVLSPADRMACIQERVDDYFAMGVQTVWVADPWTRSVASANNGHRLEPATEVLTVPGTSILVPLAEISRELDRLQGRG